MLVHILSILVVNIHVFFLNLETNYFTKMIIRKNLGGMLQIPGLSGES
jgi:hypothetical protein